MDSDGANHRFITNGQAIALSPRFSPDYGSLLYVSYQERQSAHLSFIISAPASSGW
jgi:TolB protein